MWFSEKRESNFYFMPGIPSEMKHLIEDAILPDILSRFELAKIVHKYAMVSGLGEAKISIALKDFEDALPDYIKMAYLPTLNEGVKLRLSAQVTKDKLRDLDKELTFHLHEINSILKYNVYSNDPGDSLIAYISREMSKKNLRLSTIECFTGGYLCYKITSMGTSYKYYAGSLVLSSPQQKNEIFININDKFLSGRGFYSKDDAIAIAKNMQQKYNSDIVLVITDMSKNSKKVSIACAYRDEVLAEEISLYNTNTAERHEDIKLCTHRAYYFYLTCLNGKHR